MGTAPFIADISRSEIFIKLKLNSLIICYNQN